LPSGLKETGLIDLENKEIEIEVAQKVNQGLKGFIEPYYQEISIGLAVALFFVLRFVGINFYNSFNYSIQNYILHFVYLQNYQKLILK